MEYYSRVKSLVREANLPGYETRSRGIELSQVFGIDSCRIMVRKELVGDKKTSCVISIYSEIKVNPMPGYD
jgi:hypothetical protein